MDFINELGYLAIASRLKRLTDRFMRGGSQAYKSLGIDFEPRWFTVFYLIYTQEVPLSISEIANSLKISHPAVIQTIQMLVKKGLIKSYQDSKDRRIRRLAITEEGNNLANFLIPVWNDFENATVELFEKAGVDVLDIIKRIEVLLEEEDVGSRIVNRVKQRQHGAVEILDYSSEYKEYFRKLNYEWLEKYFRVEELDKKILLDPEGQVIKKGGFVLFARLGGKVVGTTAVLKIDNEIYEIAKMAVTEKAQGMQVGRKLTEEAIARAKQLGAKKFILKTDNRLRAAVSLYRSFGFKVTQSEPTATGEYQRESLGMKMKLDLSRC
jgi:DNA-binding MarR family transcriptional regulator/N-acetylglutamate synthase-like GNAT family acetyltransferase